MILTQLKQALSMHLVGEEGSHKVGAGVGGRAPSYQQLQACSMKMMPVEEYIRQDLLDLLHLLGVLMV